MIKYINYSSIKLFSDIYDKNDNPSIITTKTAVISTIAIFIPPFVYIIIPQYE